MISNQEENKIKLAAQKKTGPETKSFQSSHRIIHNKQLSNTTPQNIHNFSNFAKIKNNENSLLMEKMTKFPNSLKLKISPPPQRLITKNICQIKKSAKPKIKTSPLVANNINDIRAKYKLTKSNEQKEILIKNDEPNIYSISKNLDGFKETKSKKTELKQLKSNSKEIKKYHVNTLANPKSPRSKVKVIRDPFRKIINEYQDQFIEKIPEARNGSRMVKSIDLTQKPFVIQSKRSVDLQKKGVPYYQKLETEEMKKYNRYEENVNQLDIVNISLSNKAQQKSLINSKSSGVSNMTSNSVQKIRGKSNTISEKINLQLNISNNQKIKTIKYYPIKKSLSINQFGLNKLKKTSSSKKNEIHNSPTKINQNTIEERFIQTIKNQNLYTISSPQKTQKTINKKLSSPHKNIQNQERKSPYQVNPQRLDPIQNIKISSSTKHALDAQIPSVVSSIDQISKNINSSKRIIQGYKNNNLSKYKEDQLIQSTNSKNFDFRNSAYINNSNRKVTMKQKIISEMRKDDKIVEKIIQSENNRRSLQMVQRNNNKIKKVINPINNHLPSISPKESTLSHILPISKISKKK